jgi:hypothetical protein
MVNDDDDGDGEFPFSVNTGTGLRGIWKMGWAALNALQALYRA